MSEYQKALKSECQLVQDSDIFIDILIKLMAFGFGYIYGCVRFRLFALGISDNYPNSKHTGIQTEATCLKTAQVRYSDVDCTYYDHGLPVLSSASVNLGALQTLQVDLKSGKITKKF